MVEKEPIKTPAWHELYDTYKNTEYDTIITYDQLSKTIGFNILEKRYIIEAFKRVMLRQNNKALENIPNKGYRIVMPNEHTRLASREVKRAERRLRKGVELSLCVDFEKLNQREQAQLTLIANRMQTVHAALIGEQKSQISINNTFTLPSTPRN